jgi:hypothetical protein
LCFGSDGLLAHCGSDVGPGGNLQHRARHTVEVAYVIGAAGTKLAADGEPEVIEEDAGDFALCRIPLGFRSVSQANLLYLL